MSFELILCEMAEYQSRWFAFLDKLELKIEDLCEEALPELASQIQNDEAAYNKILLGVCGQLQAAHDKAHDTYEQRVIGAYYYWNKTITMQNPEFQQLYDFRGHCEKRYREFEEKLRQSDKNLRNTRSENLETQYKEILEDFEANKGKFLCSQCGCVLPLENIYFISVHIACPSCGTQNTFQPSYLSRKLQFIAKELAEKRAAHLFEIYEKESKKEREFYGKMHTMKLSVIHESEKVKADMALKLEAVEKERLASIENAQELYQKYRRLICDELNHILPQMSEHHEKMYLVEINNLNEGE
ncbi:MAG: hypothetical protein LBS73_02470 [Campylobacteraceae bacterium]|nr:hypothetical protein [Campylobacteraceae bacterium]